ncbi:CocE/NonD family hydrolase [Kroppenstedtia sanguinis]|uniref:CocE/NonD family hydrolase n=1 Tax=Kroppenstedtia sanguinis TaxID=1380684 RepID=A0ABW4CBF4_9BACL
MEEKIMPQQQQERLDVRIHRDVRVPMRDGVTLSTDLYLPETEQPVPAIVVRSPYGKAGEFVYQTAPYFAARGYGFVSMDVRGRGDSDGEFIPYFNEGADGYDAVEWAAAQPWCDGVVGTMGASYLARIQWLTALTQPPHLKAMISTVTPSDPFVETPTGLPGPQHLCWLYMTSGRVMQDVNVIDWEQVYWHLPLLTMDEKTGKSLPRWREEVKHPRLDDWWRRIAYQERFHELDLPVLHISGWYDDEQVGTPLNYVGMTTQAQTDFARKHQKLVMGPWPHQVNRSTRLGELDFGPQSLIDLNALQLRWFDRWLKGEANGVAEEPPVSIFVMGENQWRQEREWPLQRTRWTPFYLHSGGRANSRFGDGQLSQEAPGEELPDRYSYDPADPVPFLTDPTSNQIGGPDDYSAVERRDDVLVYTTAALEENLEVTGPIRMRLFASSSAQDTDFMVKFLDVWPNGFAQRLTDGMVRGRFRKGMDHPQLLEPGQIYEYEIDCWNISHLFQKGHRIRVEVASSAFPKYDRNLNTGAELGQSAEMVVAEQRVYHHREYPSALILPVIPRE